MNLTDQYGRVPAQIDYDDWGKVTAYQSLNISGGYRTVLPEITYAGHQYDDVLNMYYAKARMYDAENRRFASVDPVKGRITEPMSMVQYLYVVDNPLRWVDPAGLRATMYDDLGGGTVTQEQEGEIRPALKMHKANNYAREQLIPNTAKLETPNTCDSTPSLDYFLDDHSELNDTLFFSKDRHSQGDSGLAHVPDEEIHDKAHDHSLPGPERRRYQREEKYRGSRNAQKRAGRNHSKIDVGEPQWDTGIIIDPPPLEGPDKGVIDDSPVEIPNSGEIVDAPSTEQFPVGLMLIGGIIYFAFTCDPSVLQMVPA